MPKSISQQLNEILYQASMSYVRGLLSSDDELAAHKTIHEDAEKKREELTRLYHEEYDGRVDAARRQLYDKAAQFGLNHPPPPGGDSDRASAINSEAHRLVREAHQADLQRTSDEAQQAVEDLLKRASLRNETKGMALDAFLRASDRRSGEDRRTLKHSQD